MPLTSFNTALTGMNNNATAISVIGNNLANMNTVAFKTSKISFAEFMSGSSSTSSSGNPIEIGLGSTVTGITPMNIQGSVITTSRPTDAAISGNGFFVVATDNGMGFTRAGNFSFNNVGELVSADGFKVLGYKPVGGVIGASSTLEPITVAKGQSMAPKTTANMTITANLDSDEAVNGTFSTSVQIYDSLGTAHIVTLDFVKSATGVWDWTANIPAIDTGGLITDPPVQIGTGTMNFDSAGIMISPAANPALAITGLANGASNMNITLNLLDAAGNPFITSYAMPSSVSTTIQDGYAASFMREISISSAGEIIGLFDNGQSLPIAQLAIADFPNVEGLKKYQGSTLVTFSGSGDPSIGVAGVGGRGIVVGSALEQSNVDIALEFTNLIISQRGYQANSRVITTTDELYQESLNLIR